MLNGTVGCSQRLVTVTSTTITIQGELQCKSPTPPIYMWIAVLLSSGQCKICLGKCQIVMFLADMTLGQPPHSDGSCRVVVTAQDGPEL